MSAVQTRIGLLWVLLAALTLGGCVTDGKRFVPLQGEADRVILYVYRDNGIVGRGLDLQVEVNGEQLTQLEIGTYHATRVDPGELLFTVRAVRGAGPLLSGVRDDAIRDNTLLRLKVESGAVYYVKVEEGLGYVLMEPVTAEDALAALPKLRLVPAAGGD